VFDEKRSFFESSHLIYVDNRMVELERVGSLFGWLARVAIASMVTAFGYYLMLFNEPLQQELTSPFLVSLIIFYYAYYVHYMCVL
jgi:hypothetical protein